MRKKHTKKILSWVLALIVLLVIINSFVYNFTVWYIVDALVVIVPIVFTATCIRNRSDLLVALALWVPALIVVCMAFAGLLSVHHPVWLALNMWQLAAYSYFIGTRLKIRP